ncbi:MAG: hypothetical protein IJN39_06720 [Clostridia bacterium]|nr:hypothetical protein [Clostridia bacterium]
MKLNFLFTDSMVLQRNKEIRIFGECETGAEVVGTFRGITAKAVGKDGKFILSFPSFDAGKGYELTVSCGSEKIVLKDIAVGEVWICGGQSNMEMPLKTSKNGGFELQFLEGDDLRYIITPRQHVKNTPCWGWHFIPVNSVHTPWRIAGGNVGGDLSATAFYFAKRIIEKEKVPVGIIECDWGGTSVYSWCSKKDLLEDKETSPFVKEHFFMLDNMTEEEYKAGQEEYLRDLREDGPSYPIGQGYNFKPFKVNPESYQRYGGLYETMFETICPVSVRGVIWYQGESDCGGNETSKERYLAGFRLLRRTWRRELMEEELPFITTVLAAHGSFDDESDSWCSVRDAQIELAKEDKNTYCINCMDNGEAYNIHPFEKRMLGERMAGCALSEVYGKNILWQSPLFEKAYIKDNRVYIEFKNSYDGLMGDNVPVSGFEFKCKDEWKDIICMANENMVWTKEECKDATAVRFCQKNFTKVHLYNSLGIPALPFMEKEIQKENK